MPSTSHARGRPRDPPKRQALVQTARALFLEGGVDAVTVDHVISGAKVSRATYYSNFADRNELLSAVFSGESERIAPERSEADHSRFDLREQLVRYGDDFIAFLADPDTWRLEPLISHTAQSQPQLAASLFTSGPRRAWDLLAEIIRQGQRRQELDPGLEPEQAVSDLIGMWRGSWYIEVSYGRRAPLDRTEQQRLSRHAVDLLLRVYRTSE